MDLPRAIRADFGSGAGPTIDQPSRNAIRIAEEVGRRIDVGVRDLKDAARIIDDRNDCLRLRGRLVFALSCLVSLLAGGILAFLLVLRLETNGLKEKLALAPDTLAGPLCRASGAAVYWDDVRSVCGVEVPVGTR